MNFLSVRIGAFAIASLAPTLSSAEGTVHICTMDSTEDRTSVELRVYEFEEKAHSAFVQLTTDYGDTLPYAYICDAECLMLSPFDDYKYSLQFAPALEVGSQVTMTTSSVEDAHNFVDTFILGSCKKI